jgi:hypothetical protein
VTEEPYAVDFAVEPVIIATRGADSLSTVSGTEFDDEIGAYVLLPDQWARTLYAVVDGSSATMYVHEVVEADRENVHRCMLDALAVNVVVPTQNVTLPPVDPGRPVSDKTTVEPYGIVAAVVEAAISALNVPE